MVVMRRTTIRMVGTIARTLMSRKETPATRKMSKRKVMYICCMNGTWRRTAPAKIITDASRERTTDPTMADREGFLPVMTTTIDGAKVRTKREPKSIIVFIGSG